MCNIDYYSLDRAWLILSHISSSIRRTLTRFRNSSDIEDEEPPNYRRNLNVKSDVTLCEFIAGHT